MTTPDDEVHAGLAQVLIGWMPMFDRQRGVTALRLTVTPLHGEALPDVATLREALCAAWPAEAGRLILNIAHEAMLAQALTQPWPLHMMVEVPTFMAADAQILPALTALHAAGNAILVHGRPSSPLPPPVLACLAYSIVEAGDDRRSGAPLPGAQTRPVPHLQVGVRSAAEMTEAFARGALGVLGWPFGEAPTTGSTKPVRAPELNSIVELMQRVDRHEDVGRLEAVLNNDPTLAFRLLRYINSPAFGLRVEISSFRHAIMMLGHDRLKRWLALLLVSGQRDPSMKPFTYAAVRRGLLMDALARANADDSQSGELFICGVFSLLDRMLQQPFDLLLKSIPVAESIRAALVDDAGPHLPYLTVARAIESGAPMDIREAAEALLLAPEEVNRALLHALVAARQLD